MHRHLALLGIAAALAAPALAQDAEPELASTITLDVRDASLPEVIAHIKQQTGRNILLGKNGAGRPLSELHPPLTVTVRFEDVPWEQALALVADSADCLLERVGDVWVVYQPPQATIEMERAPLRDVVQAIAAASGANLIVGSDVPDDLRVSVRLRHLPWRYALNAVVRSVGMVLVREADSDIWIVRDPERLKRVLDTRVLRLHRLRGHDIEIDGRTQTVIGVERDGQPLNLLEEIARRMSRDAGGAILGGLSYDRATNSIVVSDVAQRLDMIALLIDAFDRPTRSERDAELEAAVAEIQRLQGALETLRKRLEKLR